MVNNQDDFDAKLSNDKKISRLRKLMSPYPGWEKIWEELKKLGWKVFKPDLNRLWGLIIPPWTSIDLVKSEENRSKLVPNVDFFDDSNYVFHYIERNDPLSKQLTFSPEQNGSGVVNAEMHQQGEYNQQQSDDNSMNDGEAEDGDYDSYEDELGPSLDQELYELLLPAYPNFSSVWWILTHKTPAWTYEYHRSNCPHQVTIGSEQVYYRPNVDKTSSRLIKHEDYFDSKVSLIDYLVVQQKKKKKKKKDKIAIASEPLPPVTAYMQKKNLKKKKKPPFKKKGKLTIESEVETESEVEVEVVVEAEAVVEEVEQEPTPPPSLGQSITAATENLVRASCRKLVGRTEERSAVFDAVVESLSVGHGSSVYICGSPGLGKTLTVNAVLSQVVALCNSSGGDTDVSSVGGDYASSSSVSSSSSSSSSPSTSSRSSRVSDGGCSAITRSPGNVVSFGTTSRVKIITLTCTQFPDSSSMFEYLAEELGLLRDRAPSESKALVVNHFRTSPTIVNQPSEAEGADHIDTYSSSGSSSSCSGQALTMVGVKRPRENKGKNATVPMTILVLDEVDMGPPDLVMELLCLSSSMPSSHELSREPASSSSAASVPHKSSSLIMLGIGNDIVLSENIEENMGPYRDGFKRKVVFPVYTNEGLGDIIDRCGMGLFDMNSKKIIVSKIQQLKKGDVRALLDVSRDCLKTAVELLYHQHGGKDSEKLRTVLAGSVSPFVQLQHAKTVFARIGIAPNSEDTRIIDIVESLCPMNQVFILSLLLDQKHAPLTVGIHHSPARSTASSPRLSPSSAAPAILRPWRRMHEMERIFSTYCNLKGISHDSNGSGSSYTAVRGYVETLETYNLLSRDKPMSHGGRQGFSDKASFRLDIEPKHMLSAKGVAGSHKDELKKHIQGGGGRMDALRRSVVERFPHK